MQPALTLHFRFPFPCPPFRLSIGVIDITVIGVSIIARLPEAVELFEEVLRSVDEKKRTEITRSRLEVFGLRSMKAFVVLGRSVAFAIFLSRMVPFVLCDKNVCLLTFVHVILVEIAVIAVVDLQLRDIVNRW